MRPHSFQKLDLERLTPDQPLERGDPGLVVGGKVLLDGLVIELAVLVFVEPDLDERRREIVSARKGADRLTVKVSLNDLALGRRAVTAVLPAGLAGHVVLLSEPRPDQKSERELVQPQGRSPNCGQCRERPLWKS